MASELIGELGQVGLTIGDPPSRSSGGAQFSRINNRYNESPDPKKPRVGLQRRKKFRHAWMMVDIFKDWLRPHSSPEFAMCIACNRVIKAGKSELEKHAVGKKHLQMLKEVSNMVIVDEVARPHFPEIHDIDGVSGPSTDGTPTTPKKEDLHFVDVGNNSNSESQCSQTSFSNLTARHMNDDMESHCCSKALVCRPAPTWKATAVVNGHVTRLDLSDYKGRYLIMFFYPQDFSKLCASEVNKLSERLMEFRAIQTEIVACSVDSHLSHLAWCKTPRSEGGIGNPKIPLLSDQTRSISKDYGVLLPDRGYSLRATFVIDRRGILRHISINDTNVARGTDELLRLVKAFQHSDESEEGCTADWRPLDQ